MFASRWALALLCVSLLSWLLVSLSGPCVSPMCVAVLAFLAYVALNGVVFVMALVFLLVGTYPRSCVPLCCRVSFVLILCCFCCLMCGYALAIACQPYGLFVALVWLLFRLICSSYSSRSWLMFGTQLSITKLLFGYDLHGQTRVVCVHRCLAGFGHRGRGGLCIPEGLGCGPR